MLTYLINHFKSLFASERPNVLSPNNREERRAFKNAPLRESDWQKKTTDKRYR